MSLTLMRATNSVTKEIFDVLCRWICRSGADQEARCVSPSGAEGRKSLARARRARGARMRRRRREGGQMDVVPAQRQAQARRDGRVLLYRLQVARAARPCHGQG